MATVRREMQLPVRAEEAWAVVRDFSRAGELFAGVLTGCVSDGEFRTVTFAHGPMVRERLVTLDDAARRLVYVVLDGPFTQHSSAIQILPDVAGSRFVWITDFLPDDAAVGTTLLVEAGCSALARNLPALV